MNGASSENSALPVLHEAPPAPPELFWNGLFRENPVFVQLLGMCPVLAVTNSVVNAVVMGAATFGVLVLSALWVSLLRHWIPPQVRIASYILIIATFVTVADYAIQAISLEIHRALGAYISLIVANCIILGRAEAFASKHPPLPAMLDAASMGAGFTVAVTLLGAVREILGNGSFLGFAILPADFQPLQVMVLPGGAFFVLAALFWSFHKLRGGIDPDDGRKIKRSATTESGGRVK